MDALFTLISRRPIATLSVFFGLCVAVFLATIPLPRVDNLLIGSDGVLYYHYVHSLVIDGDLDFTDEYEHLHGPERVPAPTPAGRPPNRMPIGMGIVWIPFFVAGHAVAWVLGKPLDGYSYVHQAAVCLGSMTYGFIGILLAYRLCREYADAASSVVAVGLMWFGSNVIYYMVAEPSMSHMASLGAVSALLAWWRLNEHRASALHWIVLGALGGLAALIRPQDGLFLSLPALQRLTDAARLARNRRWRAVLAHGRSGFLMALGAVLVYSVQIWAAMVVYASLTRSLYFYNRPTVDWLRPEILPTLFSLHHGLFTWHPIYVVAAAGLWWVAQKDRAYALLLVLGVALQVYVVASWGWWRGDAFGGRMFISTLPIFAIGLAQVVMRLRRLSWLAVVLPGGALLIWNFTFFIQYRFGFIPRGKAITFQQLVWDKFTLPIDLWQRSGN